MVSVRAVSARFARPLARHVGKFGGAFAGDLRDLGRSFARHVGKFGGAFAGDLGDLGRSFAGHLRQFGGAFAGDLRESGSAFAGDVRELASPLGTDMQSVAQPLGNRAVGERSARSRPNRQGGGHGFGYLAGRAAAAPSERGLALGVDGGDDQPAEQAEVGHECAAFVGLALRV